MIDWNGVHKEVGLCSACGGLVIEAWYRGETLIRSVGHPHLCMVKP